MNDEAINLKVGDKVWYHPHRVDKNHPIVAAEIRACKNSTFWNRIIAYDQLGRIFDAATGYGLDGEHGMLRRTSEKVKIVVAEEAPAK